MNPSHRTARGLLLAVVAAATLGLGACGSSEATEPTSSTTTPTSADGDDAMATTTKGEVPEMGDLRGIRYCEVLLLSEGDEGFSAEVWNTMGLSDCPQDAWDALDADAIAQERGAILALLNGPRYWMLDSIQTELRQGAPETTFGEIAMFWAATVALGDELPNQTPYTERPVARETVFGFDQGSEVYELVDPDGTTYVMQARSQIVDKTLEESDLPTLADRLQLPDGWEYRVRTLEAPLDLLSTDGVATVIQDDLQNTYQRIDAA